MNSRLMPSITEAEARNLGIGAKPKAKRKYRNEPIVVDGRRYDSKREAAVCENLIRLERTGKIGGLEFQKRFPLLGPKGELICTYVADACYWDHEADRFRVIDVKGVETKEFRLKKRLMRILKGIDVEVVR